MKKTKSLFRGHRFPASIISCAVRWYFRFNLSLRDIEELLLERGVEVTYETIRCWCDKFGAAFARRAKAVRRKPCSTWHLDEVFVRLRGEPYVLWRAVDEHGAELDVLLQKHRDKAAAKRFLKRLLRSAPQPRKIVTDQLRSYPAAKADITELAGVKHVFVKAAARVNNRAENSHQPTRRRERAMNGFREPVRTQAFLSSFGPIRRDFALPRHQMNANAHRNALKQRLAAWQRWTAAKSASLAI
ncbi:IS6 family transposase [Trinickia violacea]|uniref:IS6 family transposase n=1 Tax=Trinickia violacea TaxID=2571746 RepID=A0A4P8J3N2_9BURK|nr:IS6 family transposase [Trinickia violacea]QCP54511.1 IS6 family transposase [Trinickia violacea]QCP54514.1 IS6 family transposase [Trinickia violacea]